MARRIPPVVTRDATPDAPARDGLEPIPGDTFAVRAELKALGAVWDPSRRTWCIAPERLALARAIVDNQTLAPPSPAAVPNADLETMEDPFEAMGEGPRLVALADQGGDTYAARDALRAVGARWDKEGRAWVIREERAAYARAIVETVRTGAAPTPPPGGPPPPPDRPVAARETRAPTAAAAAAAPTDAERPAGQEDERSPANVTPARRTPPTPTPTPTPAAQAAHPMAERIKLGGLWLHRTRDGREYLSGRLSPTVKILIFQNDFKSNENSPTHVMYLAPIEPEESQRPAPPESFFGGASRPSAAAPPAGDDFGDAGDDSVGFAEEYLGESEETPAPASPPSPASPPAPRPSGPAARPAPAANAAPPRRVPPENPPPPRPAASANPPRRPGGGGAPPPASRRPEPVAEGDADDPFAE